MSGRIVEIANNGRSLHLERGFLSIREEGQTLGRIPLDDVDAVIVSVPGIRWSNRALAALAERSVPVTILGDNFLPVAALYPLSGHHEQGRIMRAQADAGKPVRKRLWAELVQSKIAAQAAALEAIGSPVPRLRRLRQEVRSGDTSNREGLASQLYWPALIGKSFRRRREGDGLNAMLNYGYAVLRAATARAIAGAGLHPSLSLHHVSDGDAFSLADDLMEPFRPAMDLVARDLGKAGHSMQGESSRGRLVEVLRADYRTGNGRTPLSHVLVRLSQSLAAVFLGRVERLDFPLSPLPLPPELDL